MSDNFPDCFIRDVNGEIIRAKKGFHLIANQMPKKIFYKSNIRISVRLAVKEM